MSDQKALTKKEQTTDLTERDEAVIQKFEEEGLPGIGMVDEKQREIMLNLYIKGKNYNSISGIMHTKKPVVLYLAKRFDWFLVKKEYYKKEIERLPSLLKESEIRAQVTLAESLQVQSAEITQKNENFLVTGIKTPANTVGTKDQQTFLKTLETTRKVQAAPQESRGTTVNVNVGAAATLSQNSPNTIDITPNDDDENLTEEEKDERMLQRLADASRERDKK
jgi:hypothetical protein